MSDLVASSLKTYLGNLTATNTICDELGAALTFGTNLFIGIEPETTNCITIIPYGGGSPTHDGSRQESNLQVRVKARTAMVSFKTSQSVINTLHNNTSICKGRFSAIQSTPIMLNVQEAGDNFITVSNFSIIHVKI